MRRRCAVLGSPIGHSLSPVLHRAAYVALGLDWQYDAVEVREDGLAGFLDGLDESWRGLSLTMPLKRAVMPLLDEASDRALQAGAANTVVLDGGRRVGHNTDIPGAAAAIAERYDGPLGSATVLGGGATAASVLLALADLGCTSATLLVRDPSRAGETLEAVARHPRAPRVDVRLLDDPGEPGDVLVSTIPAAAQTPDAGRRSPSRPASSSRWSTTRGRPRWPRRRCGTGRPLVSGLDLLVHQAALQVELMTGLPAPMAAMRAALPAGTG